MEQLDADAKIEPNQGNPEISFSSSNSSNSDKDKYRSKKAYHHAERRPSRSKSRSEERPKSKSRSRSRSRSPDDRAHHRKSRNHDDDDRYDRYDRGARDRGDGRRRQRIRLPSFSRPMMTRKDFENYQDSRVDKYEMTEAYNDYVSKYKRE